MSLLSDRTIRRCILWSSELLPKGPRIALREKLMAAHEMGKAARAPFLVIAHPKSGNTWLRAMLSRYYQVKYDLPSSLVFKSDELRRMNPKIPSFFFPTATTATSASSPRRWMARARPKASRASP